MDDTFVAWRASAVERLPEFEALRDAAKAIKDHALANLDFYLERFADNVEAGGGKVHWCGRCRCRPRRRARHLPARRRPHGDQGQDHDRRGDRHQ